MRNDLQTYFSQFHEKIKLLNTDDNEILRDKREMLIKEIKAFLKKKSEQDEEKLITFSSENQGSYSMGTGVKPLDGDYDIDVMLLFNISQNDHKPVEVKKWVFDSLNNKPNRTVEIKRPCVRVQYKKAGEDQYHVDFAVYSDKDSNLDEKTYLAKGFIGSDDDKKIWEISDPKQLKKIINEKFSNEDEKNQFKRIIRFMKRWKDEKFPKDGNAAPTGIAISSLALELFNPKTENLFSGEKEINDFEALTEFVSSILNKFWFHSIRSTLPVEPHNNLFEKMSNKQMRILEDKLNELKDTLNEVENEPDVVDACKKIQKKLGSDFPVPTLEQSAQKKRRGFSTSSESA